MCIVSAFQLGTLLSFSDPPAPELHKAEVSLPFSRWGKEGPIQLGCLFGEATSAGSPGQDFSGFAHSFTLQASSSKRQDRACLALLFSWNSYSSIKV